MSAARSARCARAPPCAWCILCVCVRLVVLADSLRGAVAISASAKRRGGGPLRLRGAAASWCVPLWGGGRAPCRRA
eukprot:384778-Alexandrium_andersonii.AAC.1